MKKSTLRIVLLGLILALTLSQTALAEPSDALKSFYSILVDGWGFLNEEGTCAEYGDGFLKATLEDDSIVITETLEGREPLIWTFVQEGNWLTAPLGSDEDEGHSIAYLLLNKAISAQGVNTTLFLGYINALPELQSKVRTYDESEGEKKIRINIVGPYEYDLDAMDALALSEEYLREDGWTPLGEDYDDPGIIFGKVKVDCVGNADGVAVSVMEYGELDELALKAVISVVKVLQPKGWEDFVADYTELKDAEEADFTAMLNPDKASTEDLFVLFEEGYSSAYFSIGQIDFY